MIIIAEHTGTNYKLTMDNESYFTSDEKLNSPQLEEKITKKVSN